MLKQLQWWLGIYLSIFWLFGFAVAQASDAGNCAQEAPVYQGALKGGIKTIQPFDGQGFQLVFEVYNSTDEALCLFPNALMRRSAFTVSNAQFGLSFAQNLAGGAPVIRLAPRSKAQLAMALNYDENSLYDAQGACGEKAVWRGETAGIFAFEAGINLPFQACRGQSETLYMWQYAPKQQFRAQLFPEFRLISAD